MKNKIKRDIEKTKKFFEKVIEINRKILKSDIFKETYRIWKTSFTRIKKLPFDIMIWLILQKWFKSLQLRLNEFFDKMWLKLGETATNSAFSMARNKLSHKAFIHLNKEWITNMFYDKKQNEAWYKTWEWFRVVWVDWSKIRLPDEKEVREKYWTIKINNQHWKQWIYTWWLFSSIYDTENNIAIDSILEKWNYSERALAIRHIMNLEEHHSIEEKDLVLFDRWYYSGFLFSFLLAYNKEFLFRITEKSCKEAMELYKKDCKIDNKIVTLNVDVEWWKNNYRNKYSIEIKKVLQKQVKVRFIRVVLDNWEIEVLVTSLLDDNKYSSELFKDLYFKRWRIEVFYWILKDNLSLENFSWKSVESVEQDIFSSVYMANFETLATNSTNAELDIKSEEKKLKNKQQVNKQVSHNAIKNNIFDLLLSDKPTKEVSDWIQEVFKTNPVQNRPWRSFSRKKNNPRQLVNYHKRKKKHCF